MNEHTQRTDPAHAANTAGPSGQFQPQGDNMQQDQHVNVERPPVVQMAEEVTDALLDEDLGDDEAEDGLDEVSALHKFNVAVLVTIPLDNAELAGLKANLSKVQLDSGIYDFYRPFRMKKQGSELVGSFRSVMLPLVRSVNKVNSGNIMYVGDVNHIANALGSMVEAIDGEVETSLFNIGDSDEVVSLSGDGGVEEVVAEEDGDFEYADVEMEAEEEDAEEEGIAIGDLLHYNLWVNNSSDSVHSVVVQVVVQSPNLYDLEDKAAEVRRMIKFFNTLATREGENIDMFLSFGMDMDHMLESDVRGPMIDELMGGDFQPYTMSHVEAISSGDFEVDLPLPQDADDYHTMMGMSDIMFIKQVGEVSTDED